MKPNEQEMSPTDISLAYSVNRPQVPLRWVKGYHLKPIGDVGLPEAGANTCPFY